MGGSVHTIKKNTEALEVSSNETGLEVNAEKTKYMSMSWDQYAGRSTIQGLIIKPVKMCNSSNTGELHQRTKILFRKKLRSVWNQGLLAIIQCRIFCLSGYHPKIQRQTYKTIILPVLVFGCKTWTLTLRQKRRLRVSENRLLRRIFGPKRDEVTGGWKKLDNEHLN